MYIDNFRKLSKKFKNNKNNKKNEIININSLSNVYGADNKKTNSLTKRLVETLFFILATILQVNNKAKSIRCFSPSLNEAYEKESLCLDLIVS